ncbi:hypothetical protein FPQ18DRAFT_410024 [Pyronema domesticum]|nr:hypothetical protein FPQ18DRAFT_410024 [Pyronema domesticum]
MRLLNVATLKLEDIQIVHRNHDDDYAYANHDYAILSHCWDKEEVTFDDISTPRATTMAGYRKIQMSCEIAKRYGLKYIWIDICCIDKRSSYENAVFCIAYLQDCETTDTFEILHNPKSSFAQSRWFRREWTLQELFAPREIGTRTVFKNAISRITGIHIVALNGPDILKANSLSIAQKMSWAADRETTRPEDLAYFLLGVFSINIPIIYGEGEKAFQRLQLEIMKFSDDQSILAWQMISQRCLPFENIWVETSNGPLATSPADFAYSGEVKMCGGSGSPHTMTNRGLHIELKLIPISLDEIYKRTAATSIGSYGSRERKLGINFYQA